MPEATQLVSLTPGPKVSVATPTGLPRRVEGTVPGGITDLYVHGGHSLDTQQANHAGEEAQGS